MKPTAPQLIGSAPGVAARRRSPEPRTLSSLAPGTVPGGSLSLITTHDKLHSGRERCSLTEAGRNYLREHEEKP